MKISDERLTSIIDSRKWVTALGGTKRDLEISLALDELQQSRALVTELQSNAATWHRLVEAFASILDIDSSGSAEQLGKSIADKIRGYQRMQSELRALAERTRKHDPKRYQYSVMGFELGYIEASKLFADELSSLLSAHGGADPNKCQDCNCYLPCRCEKS